MNRRKLVKRPAVIQDLIEYASYIARDRPAAADRFLSAAEATFSKLVDQPGIGGSRPYLEPALEGVHVWRVAGFEKVLVFYRFDDEQVEIIRVLHGARDLLALLHESPGD